MFSYENLRKEILLMKGMRETIEGQRELIEQQGIELRELRSQVATLI